MRSNGPTARPVARGVQAGLLCLAIVIAATACRGRAETGFSLDRAAKHVRMLATTFGSRPTGSKANVLARGYIVEQLRQAGFEVRLQDAISTTGSGFSVPVVNIIAVRPGHQAEAIALVSHYDSPPESRGAADDGLGVAVCLEAGRVLAERSDPKYSLLVAITDGEELGLMGARVLRHAPEFAAVRAFLNFEAVGTSGPARLFQAGPGNSWLAAQWAAAAPFPSGSSLFIEIYRRLPNDTDFSVLKQTGVPGLNFAPTGNTFAYHTRLDTPVRLDPDTIEQLGDNTVHLVEALDAVDVGARTADDGTFFDVAGHTAFAYSSGRTRVLAVVAFVLGLLAAYKAFRAAHVEVGTTRVVITTLWSLASIGVMVGALCLGCWLLRFGTGLEQPWYAQAGIFLVFLAAVAVGAIWLMILVGRSLPVMVSPSGLPSCVFMLALPVWAVLLAVVSRTAPGTGYLFAWPLLTASVLVLALPMRSVGAGRGIAAAAGVVAGALWIPLVWPLFEFLVGLFGSLPVVAPPWVFPLVFVALISTVGPCAAALVLGRRKRWLPSSAVTSVILLGVVAASWVIAVEPSYTSERPERRALRYVEDLVQRQSWWEAGTHERSLVPTGTEKDGPRGWQPMNAEPAAATLLRPVRAVFVYRAEATGLVAPPLDVHTTTQPVEGTADVYVDTTVLPNLEGTGVAFVLPAGVAPVEASLNGVVRDRRWRAAMLPVPASGLTLRVRVSQASLQQWADARVVATVHGVPGGVGWQRLPPWLPQDIFVWMAQSDFILPWPPPEAPPGLPAEVPAPGRQG
jgi:Peptidase family M28